MVTVRGDAVRFKIYPQDHSPPHAHGLIGDGAVIVELMEDGTVRLANRPDAIRSVKRREIRVVLEEAQSLHGRLLTAWEVMHR